MGIMNMTLKAAIYILKDLRSFMSEECKTALDIVIKAAER